MSQQEATERAQRAAMVIMKRRLKRLGVNVEKWTEAEIVKKVHRAAIGKPEPSAAKLEKLFTQGLTPEQVYTQYVD